LRAREPRDSLARMAQASAASFRSAFVPDVEKRGNFVREAWDRLSPLPGGRRVFSLLAGRMVPYTGSIGARIEQIESGYARVTLEDRPRVRNHLKCVHAIALANLAELTGNVAVWYSLPDDARFIVSGLSIEYFKKARGTLTAESRPEVVRSAEKREIDVVVDIADAKGELCARATLKTLVGPKRS
jgi:uncharacterized protein (TIGR00369 family)